MFFRTQWIIESWWCTWIQLQMVATVSKEDCFLTIWMYINIWLLPSSRRYYWLATTEDEKNEVTKYFKVQKEWNALLDEWHQNQRVVIGYEWYYELLCLVKSKSEEDYIWFSFFEGMHHHAAIITSLLCSKFNHSTNELITGSLTMEQFRSGSIKYFKDPGTTVSNHLNQIMASQFEAPMFDNQFHVSKYVPKQNVKQAADLIQATKLQSQWISNFKISFARTLVSKVLAQWLQDTIIHSSKDTRGKPSYRPALVKAYDMSYQDFCTLAAFKKRTSIYEGKDLHAYGYPQCL